MKVTWRIQDNFHRELKHLAIDDGVYINDLANDAIRDYLTKRGKKV